MNTLEVSDRDLSVNLNQMRKTGVIPGIIYGPGIANTPIQLKRRELKKALEQHGEVYQINSKEGDIFVRFDEIQRDPATHEYFHFSLVQLPQGRENKIEVPIILQGEPIGVKKGGVLVTYRDHVLLEGMIKDIPDDIFGDVSNLDIGDKLTLKDLSIPSTVHSDEPTDEVIAVCQPPAKVEVEKTTAEVEEVAPVESESTED